MNFKHIDLKPTSLLKIAGIVLLVVFILSLVIKLLSSSITPLLNGGAYPLGNTSAGSYARDVVEEAAYTMKGYADTDGVSLSARNIIGPEPIPSMPAGDQAEAFEAVSYSAYIESRTKDTDCGKIAELKSRSDVVFTSANEYTQGCSYRFKVKKEQTQDILTLLETLDPRDLSEHTYTIQQQITDFTSQEEILKKKQETIEQTLNDAIAAYDEITALARESQNADALASVIDSKVKIIERLSQERISIAAQLDNLTRAKEMQLDRLVYTHFDVSITENKYIDGTQIKDSWKLALKEFVRDVTDSLQKMTIGLLSLILAIVQIGLYLFVLLVAAKFAWKYARAFWRR